MRILSSKEVASVFRIYEINTFYMFSHTTKRSFELLTQIDIALQMTIIL